MSIHTTPDTPDLKVSLDDRYTLEKGRILADETPQQLIERFGRSSLEEVFLAIARREAELP